MPRTVGETIAVKVAVDGEPRSFVWARFEYEVLGQPQRFHRRRSWWQERGDLDQIDHELWRVEATADGTHARSYDLLQRPDGEWVLAFEWE